MITKWQTKYKNNKQRTKGLQSTGFGRGKDRARTRAGFASGSVAVRPQRGAAAKRHRIEIAIKHDKYIVLQSSTKKKQDLDQ